MVEIGYARGEAERAQSSVASVALDGAGRPPGTLHRQKTGRDDGSPRACYTDW